MPHISMEIHNQYGNHRIGCVAPRGCYALEIINHMKYALVLLFIILYNYKQKKAKKNC